MWATNIVLCSSAVNYLILIKDFKLKPDYALFLKLGIHNQEVDKMAILELLLTILGEKPHSRVTRLPEAEYIANYAHIAICPD